MKQLPESTASYDFGNQLVQDLSFIKKHKRYPFRRMTLMPLISAGAMLLLFLLFVFRSLIFSNSYYPHAKYYIIFTLMAIPSLIAVKRYLDIIRFYTVQTPFYLAENRRLLAAFLQSERFAFFNHPEVPEIFMILSRNISAIGEEREVLVFIVDDRQILINSHFSSARKKFNFLSAPTHQAQMIGMLRRWIKGYNAETSKGITKY